MVTTSRTAAGAFLAISVLCGCAPKPQSEVARGRYLVQILQCGDCHTPGALTPHPDGKRLLAGSDVEFEVAGEGVFVPPNLTPEPQTGLGKWSKAQIVTALTTGVTPQGRILSAAMPWADFKALTPGDAMAIAAYLKSLPPVANKTPGPGPEKQLPPNTLESIVSRPPPRSAP